MNLILAHDYLVQMGGAERVVAAMHSCFPSAPIYTSAVDRQGLWPELRNAEIRTSWMQHLPLVKHHTHFKKYFMLYPSAFRSFGEVSADVAWISSSTFAKYLRPSPGTRTICYLHNTTRFLWQGESYLAGEVGFRPLQAFLKLLLPRLRAMDREATAKMDVLIANSRNVQRRIRENYGLDSIVINPPADTGRFELCPADEGYYLVVSRLLAYKDIALAVQAFSKASRRLIVIGEGPDRCRLESLAGPSVRFLGRLDDIETTRHYAGCRALIFPGEEDFGITPLEAMACGKPVIALAKGGALETVIDGETGILFTESTPESLIQAVASCETKTWNQQALRNHALTFSREHFTAQMAKIINA